MILLHSIFKPDDMESEPEERIWSDDDAPSGELGDSEGDDDIDEQPLYIMRIKQAVRHAIKKGKLPFSVYNTHQTGSPSRHQKR